MFASVCLRGPSTYGFVKRSPFLVQAAEDKLSNLEASAQEQRQQITKLRRERARLSHDIKTLRNQVKLRLAGKRRKMTPTVELAGSLDSAASSPLLSISTLSEPASDSPSKWIDAER